MTPEERRFLAAARRAVLATVAAGGVPRLVPVCFVVLDFPGGLAVYTPLDEKPKRTHDVRGLARVRDILARADVTLLVDRWSEDWSELAWVRVYGTARLLEPNADGREEHGTAVAALRLKYPQYARQRIHERPLIAVRVTRVVSWSATHGADPSSGAPTG